MFNFTQRGHNVGVQENGHYLTILKNDVIVKQVN